MDGEPARRRGPAPEPAPELRAGKAGWEAGLSAAVGSLREAASASLDLAVARALARRRPGFARLGRDLGSAFPGTSSFVVAGFGALGEAAIGKVELNRRVVVMRRRLAALWLRRGGRADHIPHLVQLVDRAAAAVAGRRWAG